jgi:hypothetical protein
VGALEKLSMGHLMGFCIQCENSRTSRYGNICYNKGGSHKKDTKVERRKIEDMNSGYNKYIHGNATRDSMNSYLK